MPLSAILKSNFPKLTENNFSLESPIDPNYNCIAFTAKIVTEKWWPGSIPSGYTWPNENEQETIDNFINTFTSPPFNYEICDDAEYESGFEKIALYVDEYGEPTHMTRQLENKKWASKLGNFEDIIHDTVDALSGDRYGKPIKFLRKRI